jgi:hypothetical protein
MEDSPTSMDSKINDVSLPTKNYSIGGGRRSLRVAHSPPSKRLMFPIILIMSVGIHLQSNVWNFLWGILKADTLFPNAERTDCALLFFGLPKQFQDIVLPSIEQHIIANNPHCDIFAHTFNIESTDNPRNNESECPIDPLSLLEMTTLVVMDSMEEFHARHNVSYYRQFWGTHNMPWLYPQSMDNMIKQWFSIERVWDYMEDYSRNKSRWYTQVGLFRSDVVYLDDIFLFDSKAAIPEFASCPANDRMFYGTYHNAWIWSKTRFTNVPYAYERGFFNEGLHSEYYMHDVILPQMKDPYEKKDICFLRVRATGDISTDDCGRKRGKEFRQARLEANLTGIPQFKRFKRKDCLFCFF